MEKNSFVMYRSFIEQIRNFDKETVADAFLAYADYALDGIEPNSDNKIVNLVIGLLKPSINSANERYIACVENGKKGGKYGKLGGRPKKDETKEEYQQRKQLETPKNPKDNPKENPLKGINEKPLNDNDNEDVNVDDTVTSKYNNLVINNILDNNKLEKEEIYKEEKENRNNNNILENKEIVINDTSTSYKEMPLEDIVRDYLSSGGTLEGKKHSSVIGFALGNKKQIDEISSRYRKIWNDDLPTLFSIVRNMEISA